MLKKINLFVLIYFYLLAGINHFVYPVNYLAIIPPYLPFKEGINYLSGALEIVCAILMAIPSLRRLGSWCIIALLAAFIPAHIYLIQVKGCPSPAFCFPEWTAWVRLIPLQFILMWWAHKTGKSCINFQQCKTVLRNMMKKVEKKFLALVSCTLIFLRLSNCKNNRIYSYVS